MGCGVKVPELGVLGRDHEESRGRKKEVAMDGEGMAMRAGLLERPRKNMESDISGITMGKKTNQHRGLISAQL